MPTISPRCSVNVAAPGITPSSCRIGSPADRALRGYRSSSARPTISSTMALVLVAAVGRSPALRPSRSTTKRSETCLHFLDEMRDVDDRVPRAFSRRDQRRTAAARRRGQAARRLVEHQHAAADGERARDLDQLLRRRRQLRRPARPGAMSRGRARRARAIAVDRASSAPRRRRTASARRRARCFPSRDSAARATAPDRSSRRRRGARRADRAARTARRRAASRRRRACSAPARIAISVLLPAPFWPTSAHTSPPRTAKSTPSSATVAPNALPHAAHLEARRRGQGFSHRDRSGCSSSLASGVVHAARA